MEEKEVYESPEMKVEELSETEALAVANGSAFVRDPYFDPNPAILLIG
jgi:hypothetical protein